MKTVFLLLLAPSLAAQTVIRVPEDQPTIQAGIEAATNGDTVLVAPGTYDEQIDFLGKAITVRSRDGAAATVIDSQGAQAWPDHPHGPVVRMISGEGPDTVLEGFTVTGATGWASSAYGGIWCVGLSPTVRDCIIRDNDGGVGGGVRGDAHLERCTIRDNATWPYGEGGGIYGRPTLVDCVVSDNQSGYHGGGIYATGPCTIVRTVIDGNIAGNGYDGYSGGGVFGPVTLIGCRITNNVANHHLDGSGQPGLVGTGVHGAVLVARCTVYGNRVGNGPFPADPSGALLGVTRVIDSILWGDELREIGGYGSWLPAEVHHTTVQGGWPGTGNLALDPLFRDAASGDFFLEPGSLAIDGGDPLGPLDPDGTRADMGAQFFPQYPATVTLRNGTGVNPVSYRSVLRPVIGSTWTASVDATAHGFPVATAVLLASTRPGQSLLPQGELLLDPGAPVFLLGTRAPTGGVATFALPVPQDHALGGVSFATQALVVGSQVGLSNALDLTLGL